jgi:tetratricopeptide (TPR) repeat protein
MCLKYLTNTILFLIVFLLCGLAGITVAGQGGGRNNNTPANPSNNPATRRRGQTKRLPPNKKRVSSAVQSNAGVSEGSSSGLKPISPTRKSFRLTILSNPVKCQVFIDGHKYGETDELGAFSVVVLPGRYRVRLARNGYDDDERTIEMLNDKKETFTLPLFVKVVVMTVPPQADVYLNGVHKGVSDREGLLELGRLKAGSYKLRVQRKDYGMTEQDVSLDTKAESVVLNLTLPVNTFSKRLKDIEELVASNQLMEAFQIYKELVQEQADNLELGAALSSIMEGLQNKTATLFKSMDEYGLNLSPDELTSMRVLYQQAQTFRSEDEMVKKLALFWTVKESYMKVQSASLVNEKNIKLQQMYLALAKLMKLNPQHPQLLYDIGRLYMRLNEPREAEKVFNQVLVEDPKWSYPYFGLGLLHMFYAEQNPKKSISEPIYFQAISKFTQSINLNPQSFYAYLMRCFANGVTRNYDQSIADGQQATRLRPNSSRAHYALGKAYFLKGKTTHAQAKSEWNIALSLSLNDGGLSAVEQQQVRDWLLLISVSK